MRRWLVAACVLIGAVAPALAQTVTGARFTLTTGPCTIRSGSGAPSSGLGVVCDTYFRTDTPFTVYIKTGASTWSPAVVEPGSTGITTVGTLGTGAITSGFGTIDIGADALTATGAITLGAIGAGSITSGFGAIDIGPDALTAGAASVTTLSASTHVNSPLLEAAANMKLAPVGDIDLDPAGNDVLPFTGYDLNLGSLQKKYLTLHAAELWVETLVAQETIATIGGRILVGPTTALTLDLGDTAGDVLPVFKHNEADSGDRVYLEAAGKVEFIGIGSFGIVDVNAGTEIFAIAGDWSPIFINGVTFVIRGSSVHNGTWTVVSSSYTGGGTNQTHITVTGNVTAVVDGYIAYLNHASGFRYVVDRNLDGTGRNLWYAGDAVFNTGTTGDCFIDIRSVQGILAVGTGSAITGNCRTGTTYNAWAPRWAIGDLNGLYGYGATTYGTAFGDASGTNLTIDATNGIRFRTSTTMLFEVDASGNLELAGDLSVTGSGSFVGGAVTLDSSGVTTAPSTSSFGWFDANAYRFSVADGNSGLTGVNVASGVRGNFLRAFYNGSTDAVSTRVELEALDNTTAGDAGARAEIVMTADDATNDVAVINMNIMQVGTVLGSLNINDLGVQISDELSVSGIASDGTGKVVCIKSDGKLGTCNAGTIGASTCTCG